MTDNEPNHTAPAGPVALLTRVEKTYHMDSVSVPVITRFPLAPSTVGLMVVSVTATSSEVT